MDSKTREKILHRCEILTYMGDDGILLHLMMNYLMTNSWKIADGS